METTVGTHTRPQTLHQPSGKDVMPASRFSQEWVTITKEEHVDLIHQAKYWKAQHAQLKQKLAREREEGLHKDAKIKDLQNRLFGKKSEKEGLAKSENNGPSYTRRIHRRAYVHNPGPVRPIAYSTTRT